MSIHACDCWSLIPCERCYLWLVRACMHARRDEFGFVLMWSYIPPPLIRFIDLTKPFWGFLTRLSCVSSIFLLEKLGICMCTENAWSFRDRVKSWESLKPGSFPQVNAENRIIFIINNVKERRKKERKKEINALDRSIDEKSMPYCCWCCTCGLHI